MATGAATAGRLAGGILRADERALMATAGVVFALASGGAAMSASAADAMFLGEIGRERLGAALALSNVLLAIVLAIVGGLADRLERRRVLATLSITSAVVVAGLAALVAVAPAAIAWTTYIGGKQLAAATDLAFWVVIAERVDARRSQRLLPLLAATGGAGAALGALLVMPIASAMGARGVLVVGAALLACAGVGAAKLPTTRRVAPRSERTAVNRFGRAPARIGSLVARSWRDGARAVRRYPLALHLAIVVGVAGVFGSLAYTALGFGVAAHGGSTSDFAALLGGVRGAGQILTLVVQLAVAPWLLARLGAGRALLVAPIVALAAGLGLVVAPILAVAIATQMSARVLDAGLETPAEKLTQTLLPVVVRGRVAGFLDGTAKRAGAVLGGVIAAVLAGAPIAFYAAAAVAAAIWAIAARRIARELPALAVEQVAGDAGDAHVVDDRVIDVLLRELEGDRPERAAEVLARLHAQGRTDAVSPLVHAAIRSSSPAVWRSLVAVLDTRSEAHGPALLEAAQAATSRVRALAVRAVGLAGGVAPGAVEQWRDVVEEPAAMSVTDPSVNPRARRPSRSPAITVIDPAVALAAEIAWFRLRSDHEAVVAELAAIVRSTDAGPAARAAIDELSIEIAVALAAGADDRALDASRHLQRALRRGRGDPATRAAGLAVLGRIVKWTRSRRSAELSLLRTDLLELVRERIDLGASRPAPDHALVSLMRPRSSENTTDAAEVAAALRLYGALLEGTGTVDPSAPPFGGAAGRAQGPTVDPSAPPFGGAAGRAQGPTVDPAAPPFGGAAGRAQGPTVDPAAPPFGGAAGRAQGPTVDPAAPPFGGAAGRAQGPTVDPSAPPFGGAAGRAQGPTVDPSAPPFGGAAGRAQGPTVDPSAPPFGGAAGRAQGPTADPSAPPFGGAAGRAPGPTVDPSAPPFGGAAGRAPGPTVDPSAPPFGGADGRAPGPTVDPAAPPFGGAAGRAPGPTVDPSAPPFGGAAGRAQGPTVDPDDLRRVARALGEPDDDVRAAAEAVLAALGPAAAGELISTAAWGRRRARDRAAALLADLPVTSATIDRLVDAELDALEQTSMSIAILTDPGDDLVARRLDERLREIAHTVLLLVAARRRSRPIARAAAAWRHARGALERARTLAVIEAALPRALVGRLVEAVDDLSPADRARALARAGITPPTRDAVVRMELGGRDRLARALVLHALGRAGRSAHRDAIAQAAHAEALAANPADLLRRLISAVAIDDRDQDEIEGAHDMPSRVETLIALGRVPLLAALSTRQLADVAERARWVTAKEGSVVISVGDPIDALIVIDDGELVLGDRAIVKGDVVDELACVAPTAAAADLVVMRAVRMIRLERVDFEELVDDVPGLASAVCRALGERARRAEDAAYRSPLASR